MAAGGRGSGAKRLGSAIASEQGISFDEGYAQATEAMDGQAGSEGDAPLSLAMVLAWDGNVAELVDDHTLDEMGRAVVREYEIDAASRSDWLALAKEALELASQKKASKKMTPFEGASNVKYPLLTTACIQFAARAYPAIVRGDEVIEAKPLGDDKDGEKAKRAARSAAFANDQLIYRCTEWEIGTDALLHALPAVGKGFRKGYWDTSLNRPRLDYVSAIDVVIPADAASLELTPRITHELRKYPYEIERLTRGENPTWFECEYPKDPADSQKQVDFLEQCRYWDLDDDGLSEPYIVTVHKDTAKVVRIDPAFDVEDVKAEEDGTVVSINRLLPWVDYDFLPDPQGGAYGMGFGQLLASISDVINTTINELIDAGHLANTNTGFLSSQVKLRSGELTLGPNKFKTLPGAANVRDAIYRMEFPGPNQTLFNLLEFLITTAKDITSVKDVLTGDAPGTQPATSTLALIEQGLQVFSAIYKRIYRSMTREFELLYRLNARYLSEEEYQRFLDSQPPEPEINAPDPMQAGIGHNGGPPINPIDFGVPTESPQGGEVVPFPLAQGAQQGQVGPGAAAGMEQSQPGLTPPQPPQNGAPTPSGPPPGLQGALQQQLPQPAKRPTPAEDFNLGDMDIRPVADPTAVTEMQRLAKANFLLGFKGDPTVNAVEINKRAFEAARLPEPEKLIVESNPLMEAQAQAQAQLAMAQAELAQANVALTGAQAQAAQLEPQLRQQELAFQQNQMALEERKVGLMEQEISFKQAATMLEEARFGLDQQRFDLEMNAAAMDEAERGMRLELDRDNTEIAREANTLNRLKLLGDQQLGRDETMAELRKILAEAEQRRADREQAAKDAEAERKLKASEGDKDRAVEAKKIDAQKEVAKEAAKARAQAKPPAKP